MKNIVRLVKDDTKFIAKAKIVFINWALVTRFRPSFIFLRSCIKNPIVILMSSQRNSLTYLFEKASYTRLGNLLLIIVASINKNVLFRLTHRGLKSSSTSKQPSYVVYVFVGNWVSR